MEIMSLLHSIVNNNIKLYLNQNDTKLSIMIVGDYVYAYNRCFCFCDTDFVSLDSNSGRLT